MEKNNFIHFITTIAFAPFDKMSFTDMHGSILIKKSNTAIGVLTADTLYLYTNKYTMDYYTHAKSSPYTFVKKNKKIIATKYFSVPEEILARPKDFGQWVGDAYRSKTKDLDKKK